MNLGKRSLIKPGKATKFWNNERRKLKKIYQEKGITSCEIHLDGCNNFVLGFAHKHKRRWYLTRPWLLGSFYQTILACIPCHNKVEYNSQLAKEVFERLRGKDSIYA